MNRSSWTTRLFLVPLIGISIVASAAASISVLESKQPLPANGWPAYESPEGNPPITFNYPPPFIVSDLTNRGEEIYSIETARMEFPSGGITIRAKKSDIALVLAGFKSDLDLVSQQREIVGNATWLVSLYRDKTSSANLFIALDAVGPFTIEVSAPTNQEATARAIIQTLRVTR